MPRMRWTKATRQVALDLRRAQLPVRVIAKHFGTTEKAVYNQFYYWSLPDHKRCRPTAPTYALDHQDLDWLKAWHARGWPVYLLAMATKIKPRHVLQLIQ